MNTTEKTIITITCPGGAIEFRSPKELEKQQYKPSYLQKFLDLVCSLLCKIVGQRPQLPPLLQMQDKQILQHIAKLCKQQEPDISDVTRM